MNVRFCSVSEDMTAQHRTFARLTDNAQQTYDELWQFGTPIHSRAR